MIARPDSEVVGGRGIHVQFRRHARSLEGEIHQDTVLRWADEVVPAVREKDRRRVGRFSDPRGLGAALGAAGGGFGSVSFLGAAGLAQSGPRHPASQERPANPGGLEKKLPEVLATVLKGETVQGRTPRVTFQDEARFGRMVRLRRCWAPAPLRPTVANGYERQFIYVCGAVSPLFKRR